MISESFKERLTSCLKSLADTLRRGGAALLLILTVYATSVETLLQPLGWEIGFLNPLVRPFAQFLGFNQNWAMFTRGKIKPLATDELRSNSARLRLMTAFVMDQKGELRHPFTFKVADFSESFQRYLDNPRFIRALLFEVDDRYEEGRLNPILTVASAVGLHFSRKMGEVKEVVYYTYQYDLPLDGEAVLYEHFYKMPVILREWGRVRFVQGKPVEVMKASGETAEWREI